MRDFFVQVGFGTSYLRIERLMSKFPDNGLQLSALQLCSNAAISIVWAVLDVASGHDTVDATLIMQPEVICGVLYTGLISTALTVILQTKALGKLPATDSSVIVATEPLWAAGFAALLLGEVRLLARICMCFGWRQRKLCVSAE